jgi:TfoX/Sxy family transcriptional regulator of competence genes
MTCNTLLAERIRAVLKGRKGFEEKKMFGGVGFLVNGNMACGVHKEDLILRLGEKEYQKALKSPHARIFDMTGKPMSGWVMVSKPGYASDSALKGWVEDSIAFARSLPPKHTR